MNDNSRDECGFGCMLNRYKTPLMIGGGVLTALALPFAGPLLASGAASLGAGEALASGIASAGTSLLASAPLIGGQAIGMVGREKVITETNNPNYGEFYTPRPVFGKQGVYE